MQYKIVVEWYKSKKDVELGKPCTVVDSGFSKDLTLHEAGILKSKMSDTPVCKMIRINKIVPVYNSAEERSDDWARI